jgi:ketosteroid isomerase-like protein
MTDFIVAESGIRQLHARYIDAVWRKDVVAYADCWAEDAHWKIIGMEKHGRAAITETFAAVMESFERVIQFFHPPILEVGDGTALGRTYVTEQNRYKDGRTGSTIGIYYERYVDEGDRWRFSWRHFDLFYIGPPDISGPFFPIPAIGPHPELPDPGRAASPPMSAIL